ncbi:MAG: hypothetical protein MZU79_07275 [Anaerotruncus sp.]|nr:hypothetical protein [Anaerotruncus sp.]
MDSALRSGSLGIGCPRTSKLPVGARPVKSRVKVLYARARSSGADRGMDFAG